jgi:hypothetical protein
VRVTNSGCKLLGLFGKPTNPTVALYLAVPVLRSRAFPRGSLRLLHILMLVTISQPVRGPRVQDTECDRHRHHRVHAELTMCDRWKACWKAGSWPGREQLVGLTSCRLMVRLRAWSWQARGRAQATKLSRRQPRPEDEATHLCGASCKTSSELDAGQPRGAHQGGSRTLRGTAQGRSGRPCR